MSTFLSLSDVKWKVGRSYNFASLGSAERAFDAIRKYIRQSRGDKSPRGWSFGHYIGMCQASIPLQWPIQILWSCTFLGSSYDFDFEELEMYRNVMNKTGIDASFDDYGGAELKAYIEQARPRLISSEWYESIQLPKGECQVPDYAREGAWGAALKDLRAKHISEYES